ncbi:MAG: hypothetical protein AMXMBFR61_04340 [Fimbriimonadales bacterium]
MFVDLIDILKDILARSDCAPGTRVYLDMRPQDPDPTPEVAKKDEWLCENGMKLVVDYDEQGRILGMEVWPIVESEQADTSCEPRPPAPPKGQG